MKSHIRTLIACAHESQPPFPPDIDSAQTEFILLDTIAEFAWLVREYPQVQIFKDFLNEELNRLGNLRQEVRPTQGQPFCASYAIALHMESPNNAKVYTSAFGMRFVELGDGSIGLLEN